MNTLLTELTNCYGIRSLKQNFDFSQNSGSNLPTKAYAIYAPNGSMKSSFAKTFDQLAQGKQPAEERHQRPSSCQVEADGQSLPPESLFVLKADMDLKADIPAVTNLLVNPNQKERYDNLVVDLDKKKQKALSGLQRISNVPKKKLESQLPKDFEASDLLNAIDEGLSREPDPSLSLFNYATIFDPKALEVIQSEDFREKSSEFNERYEELFQAENTIYAKGQFNPARAETAFGTLKKERFFETGHRVQLRGDTDPIDQTELQRRVDAIHARIDGDPTLRQLRENLAKTAQTRALTDLIESLDNHQFDYLIQQTRPENENEFRQQLWTYYLHQIPDAVAYRDEYAEISSEIGEIEREAAASVPVWEEAIERFNRRFLNMPFRLKNPNQKETALGKEAAILLFVFQEEGEAPIEWRKSEVKTLSQGERRGMHLLNFIFEVESRKQSGQETLFICDDPADSFDYKNKHAIVQYLEDLTKVNHFHQIILTHNFDLFRTLTRFVHRDRCFGAVRKANGSIQLDKFEGISNVFTNMWKPKVTTSDTILLATIPFTRNLIEYTAGKTVLDFQTLTLLLHWKRDTENISVGSYFKIFNRLFQTAHDENDPRIVYELLLSQADTICRQPEHNELQLENKIVLSLATRVKAEKFMVDELRRLKSEPDYWCEKSNQFGVLLDEFKQQNPPQETIELLESIGITVSSNIHLNSFMYEPILDLSTDHLCSLFQQVNAL